MATGKYHKWIAEDGLMLLSAWARDGLTDDQIAHNAGITATTLYEWKKRFPAISEALKKGKEVSDIEVENALHKKATGFTYRETVPIKVKKIEFVGGRKVRETEEIQVVEVEKHCPPETTAAIFWLKNRMPDKWRDRKPESPTAESLELEIEDMAAIRKEVFSDD